MPSNESFAKEVANGVISFLDKKEKLDLLDKVVRLLQEKSDSNKIIVLTPRILKRQEQDKIKKMVVRITGGSSKDIVFTKDTTLLDGIRIESKDKIWDFSLSNQLLRFKRT